MSLFATCIPVLIFAVWILAVLGAATRNAVEDIRKPLPNGATRGCSIFPALPIMPLGFWGIAYLMDIWEWPFGSILVGGFHAVFGLVLVIGLIYNGIYLNRHVRRNR